MYVYYLHAFKQQLVNQQVRQAASDFDPTSHADFGAATHPGVGGGTHRRRATFERCSVFVRGVRLGVWGVVLVVCVCRGCCSLSVYACVTC